MSTAHRPALRPAQRPAQAPPQAQAQAPAPTPTPTPTESNTPPSWSADPYADALRTGRGPLYLRRADGWLLPLEVERWCAQADEADLGVLARCEGAVLDIGCGPGRIVAALGARGGRALGIDVSEAAVAHTVRLGGQALHRSVFEPLPGEGRWGTALLMDGNLGIGGDPYALLARVAQLITPGGLLIAETAPVDIDERVDVHLVHAADGHADAQAQTQAQESHADDGHGTAGTPFPWARLGTPALLRHAGHAGWRAAAQWRAGGRSFVALRDTRRARDGHHARHDFGLRGGHTDRPTNSSAEPPNSTAVISSQRAAKPSPGRPVADA
ncbi:class I SAM-dependent methyltransferase [Streptomyces sp. NPDC087300]|uniref:class I SAM-dependent methyltransferase n=1 Tax=Streptomyces sp. NPDC087300 TaxID=3365780 RepID=UPI003805280A